MKIQSIAFKIFVFAAIILGAYGSHRLGLLTTLIHWIEGLGPAALSILGSGLGASLALFFYLRRLAQAELRSS